MTGKNSVVTDKVIEPPVIMTGMRFKFISKPAHNSSEKIVLHCQSQGKILGSAEKYRLGRGTETKGICIFFA